MRSFGSALAGARVQCLLPLLCAMLLAGCGQSYLNLGERIGGIPQDSVALDLFLIGDAGLPNPEGEPVLKALSRQLARDPERSFVVFLGDNVYPAGLPDSADPRRELSEVILQAQMEALRSTGTEGLFIPGNHDWRAGEPDGWQAVVRQRRYVAEHGGKGVHFLPVYGCPGPEVLEAKNTVRIVALDTQWWLHEWGKPRGADSPCGAGTEQEVVDSLRSILRDADSIPTVVVGHHPLASGGEHGGYFDWPTYLFPFHPWARITGFANQDFSGPEYRDLRASLLPVLREHPPLLYAAGHEHNLQILLRGAGPYLVVSGGGIYGHTSAVRGITGTRYARRASGYMRLTVRLDGRARLAAVVVGPDGGTTEDFATWLNGPPSPSAP